jgi:RNA polymerase sigma-70 factor (ECF subfamily)
MGLRGDIMAENEQGLSSGTGFPATRWSVVLAAGDAESPRCTQALEELCRAYWRPLYAFILRQGRDTSHAQDLTQEFFAHLLARNPLASLSPGKGRFRSFLLAAVKHFLADDFDRVHTLKRGGGHSFVSLDDVADDRDLVATGTNATPDHAFDRQWALTVLDRAFAALRRESADAGKAEHFKRLSDFLSREGSGAEYDVIGEALRMKAGAVAVAVHRMRLSYRRLVREEIAHTVSSPWEIDEEMRYLLELVTM